MNKWTLKFENPSLEKKYQQRQWEGKKIIIFKIIAILSIMLNIGKLISDQVQNNPLKVSYQAPLIIISSIILFLLFKYPQKASIFVLLLNYSFCLAQVWVDGTYGSQRSYVLGSNMMASQMILMMTLDFSSIVPQILIQSILKLVIMEKQHDDHSRVLTIIHSILIALSSIVSYYLIGCASRKQFLLTIKEDKYIEYLEKVINRPFLFFEYNQEQFQPILVGQPNNIKRWNFKLCDGCNLRSLLRYIRLYNKTLEEYFLEEIKNTSTETEVGLKQFSFNYRGFSQIDVLESITDKRKILIQFNFQSSKQIENIVEIRKLNHYYKLIKKVFEALKKPNQYQTILFDLSLQFMSGFYADCEKIVCYFPIQTLKKTIRFIDTQNVIVIFDERSGKFSLIGNKNKFSIFFLQICRIIMRLSKRNEINKIYAQEIQENVLQFQLILVDHIIKNFLRLYKQNYFIQILETSLFQNQLDNQLNLLLQFDNQEILSDKQITI